MILLCNCSLSLNVFNIGLQCNLRSLSTTVLQGSAATWVNAGEIFNDFFIANLLLSVMVKEFWRSVRILQSNGKKYSGTFFRTQCIIIVIMIIITLINWVIQSELGRKIASLFQETTESPAFFSSAFWSRFSTLIPSCYTTVSCVLLLTFVFNPRYIYTRE